MSTALAPRSEPVTVLIAALGGQGGGVLTEWIGHAARAQGLLVQATSTPGVSQRTGATTYYIEIAVAPEPGAISPVLGLTPLPGRVDVLVCAELLEAARMLERGMCTPSRTTVVASTHRVYTTREKMSGGDGRFEIERIEDAVRALSRRSVLFDMDGVRTRHRAAISAALFGAVAGSGALPLARSACEEAIRDSGKGVTASLAAFSEAFDCAIRGKADAIGRKPGAGLSPNVESDPAIVAQASPGDAPFAEQIAAMPGRVAELARIGVAQVLAYQDSRYAKRYLERTERIVRAETIASGSVSRHDVAREVARFLALWMCYDDVIRVASHKSRAGRFARIRDEVRAGDHDIVRVHDFFKPSAVEMAAILPRRLGAWLERRALARTRAAHAGRGVTWHTSSVSGALVLRLVADLRVLRPYSLRYAREQAKIEEWLALVEHALLAHDEAGLPAALELARLPRILKGYGDTHAAGQERFGRALSAYRELGDGGFAEAADVLRASTLAALDDSACRPSPTSPHARIASAGRPQPVVWADRRERS